MSTEIQALVIFAGMLVMIYVMDRRGFHPFAIILITVAAFFGLNYFMLWLGFK